MTNIETFTAQHPAEAAWLKAGTSDFARSLLAGVERYGSLTERQFAAVRNNLARDAKPRQNAEIDVSGLDHAFATARANHAKKAYIRTGEVTFSLAPATGRNPGAVYCKSRSTGEYLGKIADGRFSGSFACTPAQLEDIRQAAVDPKAAALRYAKETNRCSVCDALLTDPVSKANGIGPICAQKFGW